MRNARPYALIGTAAAVAITATMDAHGLTVFSALPLLPLAAALWALQCFSRTQFGFTLGTGRGYLAALAFPAPVLTLDCAIAAAAGATHQRPFTPVTLLHVLIGASAGTLAVLLTEEGFFRGWLWAALARGGFSDAATLAISSAVFALWHLSYVTMAAGYILPPGQVAVFIANAFVMGAIWGTMRRMSGSIVVSSVSHGVWNALAYLLFGEGPKIGLLGVTQTATFGAEIGVIGLALNCLFALGLSYFAYRSRVQLASAG